MSDTITQRIRFIEAHEMHAVGDEIDCEMPGVVELLVERGIAIVIPSEPDKKSVDSLPNKAMKSRSVKKK